MKKDIETVDYLTSTFGISLHVVSGTYGGDRTLYEILKEKNIPLTVICITCNKRYLTVIMSNEYYKISSRGFTNFGKEGMTDGTSLEEEFNVN